MLSAKPSVLIEPVLEEEQVPPRPAWPRTGLVLLGSAGFIYLGADYIVRAVVEIAQVVGMGAELIAASAVALGTSLPDVAVTVAAARRGQPEMAVGNVLGSDVLNSFAVVGISGLVGTLAVPDSLLDFAVPVMLIATILDFFMIMEKEGRLAAGPVLCLFHRRAVQRDVIRGRRQAPESVCPGPPMRSSLQVGFNGRARCIVAFSLW